MICRHCQQAKVSRPRGLCWSCFYRPGVREQYPITNKFGRRGLGNSNRSAPPPSFATNAPPGSLEKMAILEERARLGQSLWHPADATIRDEAPPLRLRPTSVALALAA